MSVAWSLDSGDANGFGKTWKDLLALVTHYFATTNNSFGELVIATAR